MPELPEVETVARALADLLENRRILGVHALVRKLRTPIPIGDLRRHLTGAMVRRIRRRAKYLVFDLANAYTLVIHLGMTGAFRVCKPGEDLRPHDRLIFKLAKQRELRFEDPRRFGQISIEPQPPHMPWPESLSHLGLEPLEHEFNAHALHATCRGKRRPIKNLIMDQGIVVGVGNIYASEALWHAKVRPTRQAHRLTTKECDAVVRQIKRVLASAIAMGGTTVRSFRGLNEETGRFRVRLAVYGREGLACRRCGRDHAIRRLVQAGRSTYFCAGCQR